MWSYIAQRIVGFFLQEICGNIFSWHAQAQNHQANHVSPFAIFHLFSQCQISPKTCQKTTKENPQTEEQQKPRIISNYYSYYTVLLIYTSKLYVNNYLLAGLGFLLFGAKRTSTAAPSRCPWRHTSWDFEQFCDDRWASIGAWTAGGGQVFGFEAFVGFSWIFWCVCFCRFLVGFSLL